MSSPVKKSFLERPFSLPNIPKGETVRKLMEVVALGALAGVAGYFIGGNHELLWTAVGGASGLAAGVMAWGIHHKFFSQNAETADEPVNDAKAHNIGAAYAQGGNVQLQTHLETALSALDLAKKERNWAIGINENHQRARNLYQNEMMKAKAELGVEKEAAEDAKKHLLTLTSKLEKAKTENAQLRKNLQFPKEETDRQDARSALQLKNAGETIKALQLQIKLANSAKKKAENATQDLKQKVREHFKTEDKENTSFLSLPSIA